MVAKYSMGHGVLRPEAAVGIKEAAQSLLTTGDRVENGINTASTSAPIEIDLSFAQATQNKQLITFVEQANTLYIKNDGISSMVKG